jgi:uncharacterized repeat protein (TIGR03943 family)
MPGDGIWRRYRRWHGVFLIAASLVATVWLAATNQLILYINPRYVVFTVIMAVIGLVMVVASFIDRPDHDHDEKPTVLKTVVAVAATVLTLGVAVALVVVPPTTLTSATADQRAMNSVTVGSSTATVASASSKASAKFTVLDWSTLLRQTSDSSFYAGKAVDVVGFVTADPDDPSNMFYLSRFVITCCAVDAQPVGVPVYLAGWKSHYQSNEWIHITGEFLTNPSRTSEQSIALIPLKTSKVKQPSEPYLY